MNTKQKQVKIVNPFFYQYTDTHDFQFIIFIRPP
jgi:hypothetical protein